MSQGTTKISKEELMQTLMQIWFSRDEARWLIENHPAYAAYLVSDDASTQDLFEAVELYEEAHKDWKEKNIKEKQRFEKAEDKKGTAGKTRKNKVELKSWDKQGKTVNTGFEKDKKGKKRDFKGKTKISLDPDILKKWCWYAAMHGAFVLPEMKDEDIKGALVRYGIDEIEADWFIRNERDYARFLLSPFSSLQDWMYGDKHYHTKTNLMERGDAEIEAEIILALRNAGLSEKDARRLARIERELRKED